MASLCAFAAGIEPKCRGEQLLDISFGAKHAPRCQLARFKIQHKLAGDGLVAGAVLLHHDLAANGHDAQFVERRL